jgi:hypothetical protein
MPNYNEQMQSIWRKYEKECPKSQASVKEVVALAIKEKLWEPRKSDSIKQCATDLSKALREEYRVDNKGRKYRAKHASRTMVNSVQFTLWADIDTAPRIHMEKAFAQRRKQVFGDCLQLKTDVDCYNDLHSQEEPIQMIIDFTQDVEELQYHEYLEVA